MGASFEPYGYFHKTCYEALIKGLERIGNFLYFHERNLSSLIIVAKKEIKYFGILNYFELLYP